MTDEQQVLHHSGSTHESVHEKKDDTVSFTMKATTLWKSVSAVLLVLLVVSVLTGGFFTGGSIPTGAAVVPSGGSTAQPPAGPVDLSIGDAPVIGDPSAPVTVIEFSDFSCPFCAAASGDNVELTAYMKQRDSSWEPIGTNLIKEYVDTGKVKFAVKFSFGHSGGHPAQLVAWCLNDESSDLYWKFYPKAFAAYSLSSQTQDVEDITKMKDVARGLGADMTKLQDCLDSKKYDSRFDREQAEGSAAGVQGTPSFFVNGINVAGAQSYSVIKQLVESELAKG